jgi:hypothetical protein
VNRNRRRWKVSVNLKKRVLSALVENIRLRLVFIVKCNVIRMYSRYNNF